MSSQQELGYWTGSLFYQPSWSGTPFQVNFGATDSNGTDWLWMQMQGWDSPNVVGTVVQRASDHGGWATEQYFTPRTVTLTCQAAAQNQAQRDVARAALQAAIPVNDLCLLTYNEPIPKQMLVRRASQIVETYADLATVQFSCVLIAPDPRKYSAVLRTYNTNALASLFGTTLAFTLPVSMTAGLPPGTVTVTNAGDFETRPVITIGGPISGPSVTLDNARFISFSALTLGAGDTLVISTDQKFGTLNGSYRAADINSWWWVLQPGSHTLTLGGNTVGGATMTIQYQDAWI
jgi:Phage tail protein